MDSNTHIIVEELSHSYYQKNGKLDVLAGVNFSVEKGEFVTIIGPSGCGKSTLLHILAGLVKPSSVKKLLVDGREMNAPDPLRVAIVFQESGLFFWKTALGNVEFGLELRGENKETRSRRAIDYINRVGLSGFEDKYPSQLSGGMKQRVSLARALALETPILLMDEPFGALDEQTRILMSEELLRIWTDTEKTVILVTHSLQEAAMLSDRIVAMTSRPAGIKKILSPDRHRPREKEVIENTRDELWSLLRTESLKSLSIGSALETKF
ncbi:MAG: ABC transporter ATP-binding protein [Thaumarchaeota archaeon]|nr:ABC transporter ATP-binding protein [Nitrososphaerota archaeon]